MKRRVRYAIYRFEVDNRGRRPYPPGVWEIWEVFPSLTKAAAAFRDQGMHEDYKRRRGDTWRIYKMTEERVG